MERVVLQADLGKCGVGVVGAGGLVVGSSPTCYPYGDYMWRGRGLTEPSTDDGTRIGRRGGDWSFMFALR